MYRHQRQSAYSVSRPPAIRPTAEPAAPTAANTPNARPRSRARVKVPASRDSPAGASTAANAPCRARAPKSITGFTAAPPRADETPKPSSPIRNARRWPSAPLTLPPIRRSPPKVSAYAVIAQCRFPSDMCSACCADGSAMFTIVPSRTTSN
ncbi:hypothetical protein LUX33_35830 [Actinomadura madurae]|nr:hypothetical protein [Actinomadura madurae]MCP9953283.1 hypothetical protein [Actinomadura madurae]MCP9982500.1 hypothetical protein [Actinomadura madurae]